VGILEWGSAGRVRRSLVFSRVWELERGREIRFTVPEFGPFARQDRGRIREMRVCGAASADGSRWILEKEGHDREARGGIWGQHCPDQSCA
jgi:hypothetical protein